MSFNIMYISVTVINALPFVPIPFSEAVAILMTLLMCLNLSAWRRIPPNLHTPQNKCTCLRSRFKPDYSMSRWVD